MHSGVWQQTSRDDGPRRSSSMYTAASTLLLLVAATALLLSSSPLLFASAASHFPGLPTPIDSVSVCCSFHSLLPRDKLIFTVGRDVYEFDFIAQEARNISTTRQLFEPPIGAGISMTSQVEATFGLFNTSTWWCGNQASTGTRAAAGHIASHRVSIPRRASHRFVVVLHVFCWLGVR